MINSDLNLPKNKIPSKLKYSEIDEAYKNLSHNDDAQNFIGLEFILLDGPPYANGDLHIGHIINRTIKDILVRYQIMKGKKVCYILGWDCHGLPIEAKAIQELEITKVNKDNGTRKIVNNKSLEIMKFYITKQTKSLEKYHMFTHDKKYYTHSTSYISSTLTTMWNLVKQKYIQYLKKPNYYSLSEKTNLAFAEIVYKDKKDFSLIFMVKVDNTDYYLLVWTTQPWTILGNEFIGINLKLEYCIAKFNNCLIICSLEYAKSQNLEIEEHSISVSWMMEQTYTMLSSSKKIIDASIIVSNEGTGILHIAPAHGFEDFEIAIANDFNIRNIANCVNEDGYALDERFSQHSLHDNSLNKAVIQYLESINLVFSLSEINHRYPFSSRSKTPVYILSTYQAMIVISDSDKEAVINRFNKSRWCASEGFETYKSVISQRPTYWCITRQRHWGIPCMLLINDNNDIIYSEEVNRVLLECVDKYEFDFWYDDEFMYGILKSLGIENCTKRIRCVLDVWFESGIAAINLTQSAGQNKIINIDTIVEGRDQHRGWFSSLGIINEISKSNIRIQDIVVHGFACYSKSLKISKSDEKSIKHANAILSDTYAEIIRLSIFSSDFVQDIIINEDNIRQAEKLYLSIYGILRFLINMLEHRNQAIDYHTYIGDIDKLIYHKIMHEYKKFDICIANNKLNESARPFNAALEHANEYIRICKDKLYCENANSGKVQSILAIMEDIMIIISKMLYLVCPGLAMYLIKEKFEHITTEYKFVKLILGHQFINISESNNIKLWDEIYHIYKLINIKLDLHKKNKVISANYEIDVIILDKQYLIPVMGRIVEDICRVMDATNVIYTNKELDASHSAHIIESIQHQGLCIYLRKISSILYKCKRCWKYSSLGPDQICSRCSLSKN